MSQRIHDPTETGLPEYSTTGTFSHEPVYGLSWCLNIHGHDHNGVEAYAEGCKHLNLAANVCGYTPVSLGKLIKDGILSDIDRIHRKTIARASERKQRK